MAICEEFGPERVAALTSDLGDIAAWQGRNTDALALHQRALEIRRRAGTPRGIAHALGQRAESLLRMGRLGAAERDYKEALEVWRQVDDPYVFEALTLQGLGEIARRGGDVRAARDAFAHALRILVEFDPAHLSVADVVTSIATASADLRTAALLLGASEAVRAAHGSVFSYPEARECLIRRAQRELGEIQYAQLLEAGAALDSQQAVDLALAATAPSE